MPCRQSQTPGATFPHNGPTVSKRNVKSSLKSVSAALLLLLVWTIASGQDNLYGPQAPQDVTFVRVFNALGEEVAVTFPAGSEQRLAPREATSYVHVGPGTHEVLVGEQAVSFEGGPEEFYTIVVTGEQPLLIQDEALRDISRGLLTVYNLAGAPLDLETGDGKAVFQAVEPGASESIQVSEAQVGFTASLAQGAQATLEPRLYSRGVAHGLFVVTDGEDVQLIHVESAGQ